MGDTPIKHSRTHGVSRACTSRSVEKHHPSSRRVLEAMRAGRLMSLALIVPALALAKDTLARTPAVRVRW